MRLNVPTDVSSAYVVAGPGATELLDALLALNRLQEDCESIGSPLTEAQLNMAQHRYDTRTPKLRFTLKLPGTSETTSVTVKIIRMTKRNRIFVIDGSLDNQPVQLTYQLDKMPNNHQGVLSDRK